MEHERSVLSVVVSPGIEAKAALQHGGPLLLSKPEEEGRLPVPAMISGLTVALVVGVFYVGILPRHLLEVAEEATKLLFA